MLTIGFGFLYRPLYLTLVALGVIYQRFFRGCPDELAVGKNYLDDLRKALGRGNMPTKQAVLVNDE